MRHTAFIILLIFFTGGKVLAQANTAATNIAGLWKGTLYNDTTMQFYEYEVGITDDNGKLSGYSYILIDSGNYYGIKKLKITRDGSKLILEDAGIIDNNYPVKPEKGVRQLSVLQLDAGAGTMTLKGTYATNATKRYHPLTGSISLLKKDVNYHSDLVSHLKILKLGDETSFVKKEVPPQDAQQLKASAESKATALANVGKATTAVQKPVPAVAVKDKKRNMDTPVLSNNAGDTIYDLSKAVATKKQLQPNIRSRVATPKDIVPSMPIVVESIAPKAPALELSKRTNVTQQTVTFRSDSLQLSLYDNGEVDGDTVSVVMNGTVIMAKERLSTVAVRKTIYIPQNTDTVQLVMYAENLGLIPPNTGLLVVRDGKDLYEIRFSGDLQKNAAIIFKRKKE